jgi:hypothetical protein
MCERLRLQGTHVPYVSLPSREEMRVETTPPSAVTRTAATLSSECRYGIGTASCQKKTSLFAIEKRRLRPAT